MNDSSDATLIPGRLPAGGKTRENEAAQDALEAALVPKPEINHLLFPPRGGNRPVLRQVLSEPGLYREFRGDFTEHPIREKAALSRRRPDPREDPTCIKDGGLLDLLATLDSQKGTSASSATGMMKSPRKRNNLNATFSGSRSAPTLGKKQKMQKDRMTEYRDGLNDMLDTLERQTAARQEAERLRMESIRFQERMKEEQRRQIEGAAADEQRPAWNYPKPADYFENPISKLDKDKSRTNEKNDMLQGIYAVKDEQYKPPHSEFNVFGGWSPHSRNLRGCELDALASGARENGGHYAPKGDGKPAELINIDKRLKELDARRLKILNFTESQKEKSPDSATVKRYMKQIDEIDQELRDLEVQQQQLVAEWHKAAVRPGLTGKEQEAAVEEALAAEFQPPGDCWQPSRLGPTELYFSHRLDRSAVETDRQVAKDSLMRTMGTLRRMEMMKNAGPHSALKGDKPAWVNQITSNHVYFSIPDPSKPGDHAYTSGMDKYVTQSDRRSSFERDVVGGDAERVSFWKIPEKGAIVGTSHLHAHSQELLCPKGCKKLMSMAKSKSSPEVDLQRTPGQLLKSTPGHLLKGSVGGAPCRFKSPKSFGTWAPRPKLGT